MRNLGILYIYIYIYIYIHTYIYTHTHIWFSVYALERSDCTHSRDDLHFNIDFITWLLINENPECSNLTSLLTC